MQRPDINTAVTCFLAPAGLIYALSFGFTFQQVLEKHKRVLNKVMTRDQVLEKHKRVLNKVMCLELEIEYARPK